MPHAWVNPLLLGCLCVQLLTGLGSFLDGRESWGWVGWVHGACALTIAALLYFKGVVVARSLKRPTQKTTARAVFLSLAILVVLTLVTGWWWGTIGRSIIAGQSVLVIHGVLGTFAVAIGLGHMVTKRFVFRHPDALGRRSALGLIGAATAGAALKWISEPARAAVGLPGGARRFTGSYEIKGMWPATSWMLDRPPDLDPAAWTLAVSGAVDPRTLSLAQLEALGTETVTAILDCTGGFYTEQRWRAIPLAKVLGDGVSDGAQSVSIVSATGYARRFAVEEVPRMWLAVGAAGQPLSGGHGAPLRLVAPDHRGFAWVKWVTRIEVNTTSRLWQPPLPLQ